MPHHSPTDEQLVRDLTEVTVWKRGSQRAPHKPLLLLLTLARAQRGEDRLASFEEEIEPRLERLLREFGPPRKSIHPEYPFWRLRNDELAGGEKFWQIPEARTAIEARGDRKRLGDIPKSVLRKVEARAGFTEGIDRRLRQSPALVNEIAARLLEEHFPDSMHEEILDAVGMPWVAELRIRKQRSPKFRDQLLRLYERRCAICGFDGRLGTEGFGLEGAHLHWFSHGGPDTPSNGLLLCSLHHVALDRGAVGISEERTLLVSQHLVGGGQVERLITDFAGRPLRRPLEEAAAPGEEFVAWHTREVFRGPNRSVG